MNESDRHSQGSDSSVPSEFADQSSDQDAKPVTPPIVAIANKDWQTVDFPGAMSVDAIPTDQCPIADHSLSLQQLEQENQSLRDRILQLEQDLAQHQIQFQLEVARAQPGAAALPEATTSSAEQDIKAAQERISQLVQALDATQHAAQRQQILVETLSTQLESSQERIAQLERDCALSQQHANEQTQQLLQAENNCRDLRTRLQRQQRQTLQLKAALEKCLEPVQGQVAPTLLESSSTVPTLVVNVPPVSPSQVTTPKNQPVRPWSILGGEPADENTAIARADIAKPLLKIVQAQSLPLETDAAPSDDASTTATDVPSEDWMNQIFPGTSAESHSDVAAATNIFDLSPFLDEAPSDQLIEQGDRKPIAEDNALLKMLAAVPLEPDEVGSPLTPFWRHGQTDHATWDDLEKLISSSSATSPPPADSQAEVTRPEVSVASEAKQPEPEINHSTVQPKPAIAPLLTQWAPPAKPPTPPGSTAVTIEPQQAATKPLTFNITQKQASPETSTFGKDFLSSSPSPLVHPLRSAKKLKSLAAVDLPTFPKAKSV